MGKCKSLMIDADTLVLKAFAVEAKAGVATAHFIHIHFILRISKLPPILSLTNLKLNAVRLSILISKACFKAIYNH